MYPLSVSILRVPFWAAASSANGDGNVCDVVLRRTCRAFGVAVAPVHMSQLLEILQCGGLDYCDQCDVLPSVVSVIKTWSVGALFV